MNGMFYKTFTSLFVYFTTALFCIPIYLHGFAVSTSSTGRSFGKKHEKSLGFVNDRNFQVEKGTFYEKKCIFSS